MKIGSCILGIFIMVFMAIACTEQRKVEEPKHLDWSREQSTEFGRNIALEEEIDIKLFLKRRENWLAVETGSGLRYWVYESNGGVPAEEGSVVDVEFEVRLLDDSLCYRTEPGELATFKVDKSDIETGVQEGIKYMGKGDRAKLIIPSHLGHGLVGDMYKIPPLQVLVVDIHLIDIR
jgi:FKBP-type peptidyl-prolyl cis-trans isomerase FkpA